jgi:phospholipid/cholesterol/gamma-HCH transport system substrate-binding protein
MENKSHAWAAGLFVIAVAALLLGLTSWLTSDKRVGDIYEMSTQESVTGLSEQAAVRFRGINVGKVTHIGFDPENKENVLVRIDIDKNLPLSSSTYATLGYQGVTGLAFVQLDNEGSQGAPGTPLVTDSGNPTRIPLRPGLLSQFADQGTFLLQQAKNISERISALLSPDNQKTILGTVETIGESANKVGAASERIQAILDAQMGPKRTNIPALVADTQATMKSLKSTATELTATAQASTATAQALTSVAQSMTQSGGMLDQLSTTSQALAESAKSLNATLLPSAVRAAASAGRTADAATRAAQNADQVLNSINDNPQSLIFGPGDVRPGPGEPGFEAPAAAAR